jgi:hypothetical protein
MKNREPVFVYCDGGFGNRVMSLISGTRLAHLFQRDVVVIWPSNHWCNLAFEEIFETPNLTVRNNLCNELANEGQFLGILHENFFSKNLLWFKSRNPLIVLLCLNYIHQKKILFSTNRLEKYARKESFLVDFLGGLNFQDAILSRAKDITLPIVSQYGSYKCLHIRRTDFPEQKSLGIYLKIVEDHPNEVFFVCSDEQDTESVFQRFPNVFFNPKKYYPERLVEGDWTTNIFDDQGNAFPFNVNRTKGSVIESIIDLLILGHGDLSLNPDTKSSFFAVAKLLSTYQKSINSSS